MQKDLDARPETYNRQGGVLSRRPLRGPMAMTASWVVALPPHLSGNAVQRNRGHYRRYNAVGRRRSHSALGCSEERLISSAPFKP